jgi:hypothetical protein
VDHSKEAKPVQTDGDKAQQRESLPAKQMKKKNLWTTGVNHLASGWQQVSAGVEGEDCGENLTRAVVACIPGTWLLRDWWTGVCWKGKVRRFGKEAQSNDPRESSESPGLGHRAR